MKLKLKSITVWTSNGRHDYYSAADVVEHDELHNGTLIKMTNGEVRKYINVSYLVVREPA